MCGRTKLFDKLVLEHVHTGFPQKDARFLKFKNIPNIISGDREGKLPWVLIETVYSLNNFSGLPSTACNSGHVINPWFCPKCILYTAVLNEDIYLFIYFRIKRKYNFEIFYQWGSFMGNPVYIF